jgi:hypothetical protein
LIKGGVGRDMISDFTTNLTKNYLLRYTETFALEHISPDRRKQISVSKAVFDYEFERWMPRTYDLPWWEDNFVLLTPQDILTRDETWINRSDMIREFDRIPVALENNVLRAQVNHYFESILPRDRAPKQKDRNLAAAATIEHFPQLIDYYIRYKEDNARQAAERSSAKVTASHNLYIRQFGSLASLLNKGTPFYGIPGDTEQESRQKIEFFKDVIENKGGHRIFYVGGVPIRKEEDVHILFRLTWHWTPSDVSREVNDGRGPADFKIARGAFDKTLVEFKLASNSQLKRNLQKQLDIYKRASDATAGFKVIIFFSKEEQNRVKEILKELGMDKDDHVILVDARRDNKPSGSKA